MTVSIFETVSVFRGYPEFLERHAQRMGRSARYFNLPFSDKAFFDAVSKAVKSCTAPHAWRLRIELRGDSDRPLTVQAAPIPDLPDRVTLRFASFRVDAHNPYCRHKTTCRDLYTRAMTEAQKLGDWDSILRNQFGDIAETGRANIYALIQGELITPPESAGVLPGIIRQILVDKGCAEIRQVSPDDVDRADGVFVSNSLIGLAGVTQVRDSDYVANPEALRDVLSRLQPICRDHRLPPSPATRH